jgi:nitrogen PTS system EIIA component
MDIASMLKPWNIRCEVFVGSKKGALDALSEILAEAAGLEPAEVLEGVASRERLGTTGLGRAVALPHARLAGVEAAKAAFLKLAVPIDFDAPDGEGVDLLFGVILPENANGDASEALALLAQRLADPVLQDKLRDSDDPEHLHALLVERLSSAPIAADAT